MSQDTVPETIIKSDEESDYDASDTETEEEEEDMDLSIRAKWIMDGATTLEEAAKMLRGFANYLERMGREGWLLRNPIDDDWGFIYNPDKSKYNSA